MKSHKILAHTADTRLYAEGSSLAELFEAAMEGMNRIIKKNGCGESGEFPLVKNIAVSSVDLTSLLIDFLSEVLAFSHEERALFCRVEFLKLAENSLTAKIFGKKADGFDEDIKAVTYHEAEVKKNKKGNWKTVVIFDI